ncbi:MAG: glutathione-regulated potassium-efflux system ancillary protein KefC [Candidatus Endobugula sp.]
MAGFGLHAYGVVPTSTLDILGDIGVMLWFTIGLKLNVSSLFKAEIWAGANEHMSVIKSLTTINSLFLTMLGLIYFVDLNLASAALIGFSLVNVLKITSANCFFNIT